MASLFSRKKLSPIVPPGSLAGRPMIAVIALMTLLACLTAGLMVLITQTAIEWRAEVRSEVIIKIKPAPQKDIEIELAKVVTAISGISGLQSIQPLSAQETRNLLKPWLGQNIDIGQLPIPRLVILKFLPNNTADINLIKEAISVSTQASVDDYRNWSSKLVLMADTLVATGMFLFFVVLAATVLTVVFATRAAIASNKDVVQVLTYVGAKPNFIAHEFEKHFLRLGMFGAYMGAMSAFIIIALFHITAKSTKSTPVGDQLIALFGSFSFGWQGYMALFFVALTVALITAATSRIVVQRTLSNSAKIA